MIKTIGIIGGGSAGYLTALCIRKLIPEIKVNLIESSSIPPIGVGEATTNHLVGLLHDTLDIDLKEFYKKVQPTWKMGLKLEWGSSPDASFYYPFGKLYLNNPKHGYALSPGIDLMKEQRSFIRKSDDGTHHFYSDELGYAYHLDNAKFVSFLKEKADERGVTIIDDTIDVNEITCNDDGIESLKTIENRTLKFDFYIDCSGFKSILMGGALASKEHLYNNSLFTDRAILGKRKTFGSTSIYTASTSMKHGWAWKTPLRGEEHLGYVYSSNHSTSQEVEEDFIKAYAHIEILAKIKFKSSRRHHFWNKNVAAIGNSYGFIEPLEATGIQLIINSIIELIKGLKNPESFDVKRVNYKIRSQWDFVTWLLAIHYKFNKKINSPFWQDCNAKTNIEEYRFLIDVYKKQGPISHLSKEFQNILLPSFIYDSVVGKNVIDALFLAFDIPSDLSTPTLESKERHKLKEQEAKWTHFKNQTITHDQGLKLMDEDPESLLKALRFCYMNNHLITA